MSHPHHIEAHKRSSDSLQDWVLGMSDGLTVPFALAAGLSGAVDSTWIIVIAGIAEIVAGTISMGLGGYMAAKTEAEFYDSEYQREVLEVEQVPHLEVAEVVHILQEYGLDRKDADIVAKGLQKNPKKWVDFMMRFELGLEKPNPKRLLQSPVNIGLGYALAGLIPLSPYIFLPHVHTALMTSVVITLIALFCFGGFKGYFTNKKILRSALQTTLIGGTAAAAAFFLARLFS